MPIPQLKTGQGWKHSSRTLPSNNNNKPNRKKKKDKNSFFSKLKKHFLYFVLLCFLIGIIGAFSMFFWLSGQLPDPNKLTERIIAESTKIYDRTGENVLYEIHGAEKRTLVELADIPNHVQKATIAIEDKDFYKHRGVSLWAIFRTAVTNILFGRHAGGSTLTQQFVKNSILTNEHSYIRKMKEALIAYRLEKKFSKDEILQMYFNEIPYGSTAYGVEAASQRYFGKSVGEINIAEGAVLAAITQAPSRYSPYGSHKEVLMDRQKYVLGLMAEQGHISEEEAKEAKEFEIVFKKPGTNIKAPHFVMYVKEMLSEKYGQKTIEQGGLKIITSLDMYKQEIAEEVVTEIGEKNNEEYEATNAALLSIDPKTGQILAMVGSRDYFNDDIDGQVNITTSIRQPGSSIKPLVYAASFIKGYTPETILYDVVTNFSLDEEEPYEPHNYDLNELGPVSIRKSLAGSLNIPAVKTIYLAGKDNVLDLADDLGYTTFEDRKRLGLSLVLGGGEVKMIEHVNAYSAFAREGYIRDLMPILKVEDKDGKILEEYKEPKERKVLDPLVARQINDILSDNNARAYAFGLNNWLTLGERPVAAKTGTTNDYHDAWTIGYTPSIVTGVWVGNNDNAAMKRGAAGGVVAAPIWNEYMKRVLGDTPHEEFKEPEKQKTGIGVLDGQAGFEEVLKIDKVSGLLATEDTPPEMIEEKTFFIPHSILYHLKKEDPQEENPSGMENDSQYQLWEDAVLAWFEKEVASSTDGDLVKPPTEHDTIHTAENKPGLIVNSPKDGAKLKLPTIKSNIETESRRGISFVDYYINGNLLETVVNYPYNINKDITFLNNGYHTLTVRSCDDAYNCTSQDISFQLTKPFNTIIKDSTIKLSQPINGIAVSNFSFPIGIKVEIDNPRSVAKINSYYQDETGNTTLIKTFEPVNNKIYTTIWPEIPTSGTYTIYSEIIAWSGKIIKSNEAIVIVNNNEVEIAEENEDDKKIETDEIAIEN